MQQADLYQPIEASRVAPPPLVIRAIVTPSAAFVEGGTRTSTRRVEEYVLLSALPQELRERVRIAVQALVQGG